MTPPLGNLLRLTPLPSSDLPSHPSLLSSSSSTPRPDLLPFILALLSQGRTFLSPGTFPSAFTYHSTKTSKDASENVPVEVHKLDVPATALQGIDWEGGNGSQVRRSKPAAGKLETEHWFTRHSRHVDQLSTGEEARRKGGASWGEFVFGLRDAHSQHEQDFTPTLYASHVLFSYASQIATALESYNGQLTDPTNPQLTYRHVSLYAVEMCHALPAPLSPRCFPALVLTASISPKSFIAITVPLLLDATQGYYSAGQNTGKETDAQKKKGAVVGAYAAVETVFIDEKDGMIDWTMATASNARGNLPMAMQKLGLPGAVVKDVGYFLRWIRTVGEGEKGSVQL